MEYKVKGSLDTAIFSKHTELPLKIFSKYFNFFLKYIRSKRFSKQTSNFTNFM